MSARCQGMALSRDAYDIYWNISNPIFDRSNTDHVIDIKVNVKIEMTISIEIAIAMMKIVKNDVYGNDNDDGGNNKNDGYTALIELML